MMKYFIGTAFFVILLSVNTLNAQQNTFSANAGYGAVKLMGDISTDLNGAGGMAFYYTPLDALETGFSFNIGSFKGTDESFVHGNHHGVSLLTNFVELSIKARYNLYSLINDNPYEKWAVYVSAGAGFIDFRDRLEDLNGNLIEGYGYDGAGNPKRKATTEVVIPVGLAVKYRFDKHYALSFEPSFNWCNTDKLDYISDGKKEHYLFLPLVFEYKIYPKNVQ